MPSIVVKNFNNADEVPTPDKTKAEVVELGNVTAMKSPSSRDGDGRNASNRWLEQNPVKKGMLVCWYQGK